MERRKWLPDADLTPAGGETDEFDDHAVHYAVLDSATSADAEAHATVRFIEPDVPLPVLELFPELGRRVAGAHEVSRYIARSSSTSRCIRAVIIAHLLANDVQGVAVISPSLARLLARQSLVVDRLTEHARVVPKYGAQPQIAVAINAQASANDPENVDLVQRALAQDWHGVMKLAHA